MPFTEQRVISIRKWSDKTFSFTTTRPDGFQFENGQFVTVGLRHEGKLIARAYSIVSTNDVDYLEFLSIHVPGGPFTSLLVNVREGEGVLINSKPTGSLTLKYIQPGRNLYLLSTGTGLAPFVCLIRDPEVYQHYEKIILVHTVRTQDELAYRDEINALSNDRLLYVPTVTREPFETTARVTDLFRTGALFSKLALPAADPAHDRVMLCGNPHMLLEMRAYLEANGWTMTSYKGVGNFTVEKAFVLHDEG
ncbi:MAG: ferredoxin--NADP reductase [Burkholderiales bacterium]|nr:ferredoxin--NADP reductase [Burkholderiales bacterium]